MFEFIGAIFSSTGFGAAIGAIGGLLNRIMDYQDKKLAYADKRDQRAHDLLVLDKEIQGRVQVASIEGEAKIESAAYDTMAASYASDKATYGIKFVDAIRGVMRPLITLAFVGAVGYINYRVWMIVGTDGVNLSPEQLFEIIRWTLFEAAVVIGWWFASRPTGNAGLKLR